MILSHYADGTFLVFQPYAVIDLIKDDIMDMFNAHADEVHAILPWTVDPDWDAMKKLNGGAFLLVKDDKIVGYSNASFTTDLHRKGVTCAIVHAIFVHKEYRGIRSYRFVSDIVKYLRNTGVNYISFGISPHKDFSKILKRLGAEERHIEYVFVN